MVRVFDFVLFISTIVNFIITFLLIRIVDFSLLGGWVLYAIHIGMGIIFYIFIIKDEPDEGTVFQNILYIVGILVLLYFSIGGAVKIVLGIIEEWTFWKLLWMVIKGYGIWFLLYIPLLCERCGAADATRGSIRGAARGLRK